jgi:hypothetical protein
MGRIPYADRPFSGESLRSFEVGGAGRIEIQGGRLRFAEPGFMLMP